MDLLARPRKHEFPSGCECVSKMTPSFEQGKGHREREII